MRERFLDVFEPLIEKERADKAIGEFYQLVKEGNSKVDSIIISAGDNHLTFDVLQAEMTRRNEEKAILKFSDENYKKNKEIEKQQEIDDVKSGLAYYVDGSEEIRYFDPDHPKY